MIYGAFSWTRDDKAEHALVSLVRNDDARISVLEDENVALAAERKTRRDLLRFGRALGATAAAVATMLNFLFLHIGE